MIDRARMSDLAMMILSSLPKEPALASRDDLVEDVGFTGLATALDRIERRYGLVRSKVLNKRFFAIPATSWERATADARVWWRTKAP